MQHEEWFNKVKQEPRARPDGLAEGAAGRLV
jgi:hypothetical protein